MSRVPGWLGQLGAWLTELSERRAGVGRESRESRSERKDNTAAEESGASEAPQAVQGAQELQGISGVRGAASPPAPDSESPLAFVSRPEPALAVLFRCLRKNTLLTATPRAPT